MQLEVNIKITPHPKTADPRKLDELLNGALSGFEKYFMERQIAAGRPAVPLLGAERSIIKSFVYYIATRDDNALNYSDTESDV